MSPCGTDEQTTSEDRATQLLSCDKLSLAIFIPKGLDFIVKLIIIKIIFKGFLQPDSCGWNWFWQLPQELPHHLCKIFIILIMIVMMILIMMILMIMMVMFMTMMIKTGNDNLVLMGKFGKPRGEFANLEKEVRMFFYQNGTRPNWKLKPLVKYFCLFDICGD